MRSLGWIGKNYSRRKSRWSIASWTYTHGRNLLSHGGSRQSKTNAYAERN